MELEILARAAGENFVNATMGTESEQYEMPAELDTYMQESVFHMLGFCGSEEHLKRKLVKAEESYRDVALQMQHVQLRLRELEYKRTKSKVCALSKMTSVKMCSSFGHCLL